MPAPTIARIRAYSAAEAPDSSRIMLMKLVTIISFPKKSRAPFYPGPGVTHQRRGRPADRPAPRQLAARRTGRRSRRGAGADLRPDRAHGVRDVLAKRVGGERNAGADDRQDQGVFGRRSAGLGLHQVDERLHVVSFPQAPAPRFARHGLQAFALIGGKAMLPSRGRVEPRKDAAAPVAPELLAPVGCPAVKTLSTKVY